MKLRFERGRRDDLKTLHPAYFAMVMATGIVAISAHLHDMPALAALLFWLNALFLAGLLAATGARLLRYPRDVAADLRSHSRGVGFFTIVAALAVFGTQLDLQQGEARLAAVFWAVAAILWVVMTYGGLALLIAKADKPRLGDGLNGGWLVIVVAPQSVVLLTVLLLSHGLFAGLAPGLMFMALVLWLAGGALYLWIMTLIFYRYMFVVMTPEDFAPTDWINMGAAAISALAGATLVQHASLSPLVGRGRAVRQGPDAVLLGRRHLVDSAAGGPGLLAHPDRRPADRLWRARLGRCLPPGDVLGVDLQPDGDPGRAVPRRAVDGVHDHRPRGVAADPAGLGRQPRGGTSSLTAIPSSAGEGAG